MSCDFKKLINFFKKQLKVAIDMEETNRVTSFSGTFLNKKARERR